MGCTLKRGYTLVQPNLKLDLALDNGDIKHISFLFINRGVTP